MPTNQLKLNLQTCQTLKKPNYHEINRFRNSNPQPLSKYFENELRTESTQAEIANLNATIYLLKRDGRDDISQGLISSVAGNNIDTSQKLLKKLEVAGFMASLYMGVKKIKLYKMPNEFKDIDIIQRLKDILPALVWESPAIRAIKKTGLALKEKISCLLEYSGLYIESNKNIYNLPSRDEIELEEMAILQVRRLCNSPNFTSDHLETIKKRNLILENVSQAVKDAAQLLSLSLDEIIQLALDEAAEYFAAEIDSFVGFDLRNSKSVVGASL